MSSTDNTDKDVGGHRSTVRPFGDGRGANGRFRAGNRGGPGNPYAKRVGALRKRLIRAVTPDDLEAAVRKLVELAREGNLPAIRELLDRTLGWPVEADLIERLEQLEQRLARRREERERA